MLSTKYFFLLILVAAGLVFIVLFHWFASTYAPEEQRMVVQYDSGLENNSFNLYADLVNLTICAGNPDRLLQNSVRHWQTMTNQEDPSLKTINFDEQLVVIYNRVPKTGSTSFVNLTYDLCRKNAFHVLHINITANMHVMSLPNQIRFVRNVTAWEAMKPAFYHGHLAYLNFVKLGVPAARCQAICT